MPGERLLTRLLSLRRAAPKGAPERTAAAEDAAAAKGTAARGATAEGGGAGRGAADRGSVAVFTVVFAVAVIFLTALIVDGGNAMNARERAADIAGQAARAAAQAINTAALRGPNGPPAGGLPIDWNRACQFAGQVVQNYGATLNGTTVTMAACPAQGSGPTVATVTVQVVTKPLIGGGILGAFTESATGTATSECGNANQQGVC